MKLAPVLTLLALGAALFLSGCGNATILSGMAVELAGLDRTGGGARATLRYVNPNAAVYNVNKSEHKIYLGDRLAGTIVVTDPVGVPAQATINQEAEFKPAAGVTLAAGEAAYRIESSYELRLYGDSMQGAKSASRGTVVIK